MTDPQPEGAGTNGSAINDDRVYPFIGKLAPTAAGGFEAQANQSQRRHDEFTVSVRAIYDPTIGAYVEPLAPGDDGRLHVARKRVPDTAYRLGDVVRVPHGRISPTGYLQLQPDAKAPSGMAWHKVQEPDADFLAQVLDPVTLLSTARFGRFDRATIDAALAPEIAKTPLLGTMLDLNERDDDSGTLLRGLLYARKDLLQPLSQHLSKYPDDAATTEGRQRALMQAIVKRYGLDDNAPMYDQLKYPDIDPLAFETSFRRLAMLEREAETATPAQRARLRAQAAPLLEVVSKPMYHDALIAIQREPEREAGRTLLASMDRFFPRARLLADISDGDSVAADAIIATMPNAALLRTPLAAGMKSVMELGIGAIQIAAAITQTATGRSQADTFSSNDQLYQAADALMVKPPPPGAGFSLTRELVDIGNGAMRLAPYIALGMATGGIGSGVAYGTSTAGRDHNQGLRQQLNNNQSLRYSATTGLIAGTSALLLPQTRGWAAFTPTAEAVQQAMLDNVGETSRKLMANQFARYVRDNAGRDMAIGMGKGMASANINSFGHAIASWVSNKAAGTSFDTSIPGVAEQLRMVGSMTLLTAGTTAGSVIKSGAVDAWFDAANGTVTQGRLFGLRGNATAMNAPTTSAQPPYVPPTGLDIEISSAMNIPLPRPLVKDGQNYEPTPHDSRLSFQELGRRWNDLKHVFSYPYGDDVLRSGNLPQGGISPSEYLDVPGFKAGALEIKDLHDKMYEAKSRAFQYYHQRAGNGFSLKKALTWQDPDSDAVVLKGIQIWPGREDADGQVRDAHALLNVGTFKMKIPLDGNILKTVGLQKWQEEQAKPLAKRVANYTINKQLEQRIVEEVDVQVRAFLGHASEVIHAIKPSVDNLVELAKDVTSPKMKVGKYLEVCKAAVPPPHDLVNPHVSLNKYIAKVTKLQVAHARQQNPDQRRIDRRGR